MVDIQEHLLGRKSVTYNPYYNGKMSYTLHGKAWENYVAENFPNLSDQQTSENIYKAVIDLYAENLVPLPDELRGFSNVLVPLLSRGECPVLVDSAGTPHFPEHYEMISDGGYTVAAIFTRSIKEMKDFVVFAHSDGHTALYAKDVPDDFSSPTRENGLKDYQFVETKWGNTLFRFALDDKGFGASLAALQDRVNHSIIDQTVVAEMYARPFWYLLNVMLPPTNPYVTNQPSDSDAMREHKNADGAAGRIFTTSSEGPFGQLDPPTIGDMIGYHDSIIDKIPQSFGVPAHYIKPGSGTPPTGVALKVLSKRFNNKVARMREDLTPEMERLADLLGVERTVEVKDQSEKEFELWNSADDLLQESMDAHGIALSAMGYPLDYIAEVVTPGVDLDEYQDDSLGEMTPGQIEHYAQNPGQVQGAQQAPTAPTQEVP